MQSSITFSLHANKIINYKPKSIQLSLRSNIQPKPILISLPSTSKSNTIYTSKAVPLHCGISSNSFSSNEERGVREWIELGSEAISTAFPLWVTIGCVLGLVRPSSFNWVTPKLCTVGLSVIMLGMGMTLTLDDLRSALFMPKEVISGFVLQYSVSVHCKLFIFN